MENGSSVADRCRIDEFHQLFVPGRSGQVSDVILDSAGAAIGVLIMTGIEWLRVRKMAQKEGQNG